MDTIIAALRRAAPGKGPLLPARAVWERFGICDRTLDRWLESSTLAFPRPIVIRKRRYWHLDDLQDFERAIEAASNSEMRAAPPSP